MQKSGLRKKQKRDLLQKITALVGRKLHYLNKLEGRTYLEISDATGIPNNRISEYFHFDKHQRALTKEHLSLFIGGGIVEVAELKKTLELSEAERDYLETLNVYEDKKLKEYAMLLKKGGFDPGEILKKAWESKGGKKSV